MADNSTLPVNVGTEVFANDDIGGVKYPRVKMTWGPDATANDTDVASGKLSARYRADRGADRWVGTGGSSDWRTKSTFSPLGQATMANSQPVVIASNQSAIPIISGGAEYETVAASQTAQVLGATGATGDYIAGVLVIPATTTPGVVTLTTMPSRSPFSSVGHRACRISSRFISRWG